MYKNVKKEVSMKTVKTNNQGSLPVVALFIVIVACIGVAGYFVATAEDSSEDVSGNSVETSQDATQEPRNETAEQNTIENKRPNDSSAGVYKFNDMATIKGLTAEYAANNNGKLPETAADMSDKLSSLSFYVVDNIRFIAYAESVDVGDSELVVMLGASCGDAEGQLDEANSRSFVALASSNGELACL